MTRNRGESRAKTNSRSRGLVVLAFVSASFGLAAAPLACRTAQEVPSTSSNTHWVQQCSTDEECGEDLRCYCGLCTAPCNGDEDCRTGSRCVATDEGALSTACEENGGPDGAASVCVGTCDEEMCSDALLSCQDELCLPPPMMSGVGGQGGERNGGGDGDGDGDGDTPGDGDMPGDGDGDMPEKPSLKQLALGTEFSCALMVNGDVICWGANENGQLGLGDTDPRGDEPGEAASELAPVDLGMENVVEIAAGQAHACARDVDGRIKCWGANGQGQLGLGDTDNRGDDPSEMGDNLPYVNLGNKLFAQDLALGTAHTCARLIDNTIKCWGEGSQGQLGQGNPDDIGDGPMEMGDNLNPIELGPVATTHVAAMTYSTCAALSDNTLKCWGANNLGQLGQGHPDNIGDDANEMGTDLDAIDLGTFNNITTLNAGGNHLCVGFDQGHYRCFGANTASQLGEGGTNNTGDEPLEMGMNLSRLAAPGANAWAMLSTGRSHTCGVTTNHRVRCWGANVSGQLGLGNADAMGPETSATVGRASVSSAARPTQVLAGADRTCVIYEDVSLQCFGRNNVGQLGLGDTMDRVLEDELGDNLSFVFAP